MTRPANVSGLVYRCTHCDAVFPPASTAYVPIPGRAIELCAPCYAAWKAERKAA